MWRMVLARLRGSGELGMEGREPLESYVVGGDQSTRSCACLWLCLLSTLEKKMQANLSCLLSFCRDIYNNYRSSSSAEQPRWILIIGAVGIVFGLAMYGYKLIRVSPGAVASEPP